MKTTSLSDRKKSLLFTILIYTLLLVTLFFIRFWPPYNATEIVSAGGGGGGIEVNFGDSDLGAGKDFKSEILEVKSKSTPTPTVNSQQEDIISQDNSSEDNAVIPKNENVKKTTKVDKQEVKPVVEKPKVNTNATDALSNILKGNSKGGDGDDKTSGNKGKSNGNLNSSGYYGTGGSGGGTGGGNGTGNGSGSGSGNGSGSGGGSGSGSGYSLGNRKALSKPQPNYNCGNESGLVVVQITVDKNGNVIDARPGARGTTNSDSCLMAEAKKAALKTKWEPSPDGTEKQVGSIKYNFSIKD